MAVDWINQHLDRSTSVAIFTDSQSLYMALLGYSPDLAPLRLSINNTVVLSYIQWIPGHCDIRGNILADSAAKFATTYPSPPKAVTLSSACAAISKVTRDPPLTTPAPGRCTLTIPVIRRRVCFPGKISPCWSSCEAATIWG